MLTFQLNFISEAYLIDFCFGSISNRFSATETREIILNENVYDFSVDYNSLDNSEILSVHEYLMIKNNIKQCSALLKKCFLYY